MRSNVGYEKIHNLIVKIFNEDASRPITKKCFSTPFREMAVDSIALMIFISKVQEKLDIEFDFEKLDLEDISTIDKMTGKVFELKAGK